MKPTFRVSLTASPAGENSQSNPRRYYGIQYSNRPDVAVTVQKKSRKQDLPWNLRSSRAARAQAIRFKIQNQYNTIKSENQAAGAAKTFGTNKNLLAITAPCMASRIPPSLPFSFPSPLPPSVCTYVRTYTYLCIHVS